MMTVKTISKHLVAKDAGISWSIIYMLIILIVGAFLWMIVSYLVADINLSVQTNLIDTGEASSLGVSSINGIIWAWKAAPIIILIVVMISSIISALVLRGSVSQ